MSHSYRTVDVTVPGGLLHAGVWEPDWPPVATVLAIHGITATHRSWDFLPPELPGVRVIAPDLRGRGRSNALPGPFGMARHAEDLAVLLRALGLPSAVVVGHSMGAFVAVVLAHRHAGLVEELVLVDGGLPLDVPTDVDPDVAMQAVLGPAVSRLSMTFPDHAAYRAFWHEHPAFTGPMSTELADYFDYDLEPAGDAWRPSSRLEAVTADQRELVTGESVRPALAALDRPVLFVHAPRGLQDADPLYDPAHVRCWQERMPDLTVAWASDVNHYTVVMSTTGAADLAAHLSPILGGVR